MNSTTLRVEFKKQLDPTIKKLNKVLRGDGIAKLQPVLERIGRGGKLPHWYIDLREKGTLPNLDGKTIGSVVEMLLVGVLETHTFASYQLKLRVNPARGTDLPDLDLGVKSPSTNYCTSEPFFSAYERLMGSTHDAIILLTDYQEKKNNPPLKLQIIKWRYLTKTEIADEALCRLGLKNRAYLMGQKEVWAQKMFRFLAFVNQSDWRAKQLLRILGTLTEPENIPDIIKKSKRDFELQNKLLNEKNRSIIPDTELTAIEQILTTRPLVMGVIDALDNWVVENLQEAARMPGTDEWKQLKQGPLNGRIGMSFALQWRFNFGRVFTGIEIDKAPNYDSRICLNPTLAAAVGWLKKSMLPLIQVGKLEIPRQLGMTFYFWWWCRDASPESPCSKFTFTFIFLRQAGAACYIRRSVRENLIEG